MNKKTHLSILAAALSCILPCAALTKAGIADDKGNVIVPYEYISGRYLGQGLYLMYRRDNTFSMEPRTSCEIFDHDGKTVTTRVPLECAAVDVTTPDGFDKRSDFATSLPTDVIVKFRGSNGYGLCTGDEKIILDPNYRSIWPTGHGYYAVYNGSDDEPETLAFVIEAATGKRVSSPPNSIIVSEKPSDVMVFAQSLNNRSRAVYGYMARDGKILIEQKFAWAGDFTENGLAAVKVTEDGGFYYINKTGKIVSASFPKMPIARVAPTSEAIPKGPVDRIINYYTNTRFNSEEFKHPPYIGGGMSRQEQLGYFLRSFNVIGMSRKQLVELLGGDGLKYAISHPSCAHSEDLIEFEYADDKVTGWRKMRKVGENITCEPWNRTNVDKTP